MESLQALKARLGGIKNIRQITKAMELVAATKMRKSQEKALASRPYAFTALHLLTTLSKLRDSELAASLSPLFIERTIKKTLVVVLTSDKGLAGSFNSSVLKAFDRFVAQEGISADSSSYSFLAIGNKALAHVKKFGAEPVASFTRVGDYTTVTEVSPIAEFLISGFERGEFDRVVIFSTHFRNALKQDVLMRDLLPIKQKALEALITEIIPSTGRYSDASPMPVENGSGDLLLEPSPEVLVESLGRHLVLTQVYHLVLEANASEHAARRSAMKSASDNAKDLGERLTLQYNKSRQAAITKELIEISAGTASQGA
ncbi:MAG: ATP synthase F1 subunit gamma [Candidatus Pacebacteria bacterium]|nr:ATP synthase F1 subunit gamma [Candidatus Paceibacterota bacterium]